LVLLASVWLFLDLMVTKWLQFMGEGHNNPSLSIKEGKPIIIRDAAEAPHFGPVLALEKRDQLRL
jgi:hypothetical protein